MEGTRCSPTTCTTHDLRIVGSGARVWLNYFVKLPSVCPEFPSEQLCCIHLACTIPCHCALLGSDASVGQYIDDVENLH